MDDAEFDRALLAAAFQQAALDGWSRLSIARAAAAAGLDLGRARLRAPSRQAVLVRFGRLADQSALSGAPGEGPVRDRLFDILMRRVDVLQAHRAGMLALLRWLPTDPPTALLLALLTRRSMAWMLEGAGLSAQGLRGALRSKATLAVWVWTLRAWQRDDSLDLGPTMATLDTALRRAEQAALMCRGGRETAAPGPPAAPEPPAEVPPEPPPTPPGSPKGPVMGPSPALPPGMPPDPPLGAVAPVPPQTD